MISNTEIRGGSSVVLRMRRASRPNNVDICWWISFDAAMTRYLRIRGGLCAQYIEQEWLQFYKPNPQHLNINATRNESDCIFSGRQINAGTPTDNIAARTIICHRRKRMSRNPKSHIISAAKQKTATNRDIDAVMNARQSQKITTVQSFL